MIVLYVSGEDRTGGISDSLNRVMRILVNAAENTKSNGIKRGAEHTL
jgi:hypothetical protein